MPKFRLQTHFSAPTTEKISSTKFSISNAKAALSLRGIITLFELRVSNSGKVEKKDHPIITNSPRCSSKFYTGKNRLLFSVKLSSQKVFTLEKCLDYKFFDFLRQHTKSDRKKRTNKGFSWAKISSDIGTVFLSSRQSIQYHPWRSQTPTLYFYRQLWNLKIIFLVCFPTAECRPVKEARIIC